MERCRSGRTARIRNAMAPSGHRGSNPCLSAICLAFVQWIGRDASNFEIRVRLLQARPSRVRFSAAGVVAAQEPPNLLAGVRFFAGCQQQYCLSGVSGLRACLKNRRMPFDSAGRHQMKSGHSSIGRASGFDLGGCRLEPCLAFQKIDRIRIIMSRRKGAL